LNMQGRCNLIIAAHPDDEILGCGGLICKLNKQGRQVHVLILTPGAETRYPIEMEQVLRTQAVSANKKVGTTEVYFENFPNQQLDTVPLSAIIQTIEKYIGKINPDTVFTHHSGDLNKDHRIVYEAAITATRPFPGQTVKTVYSYSVPSSTEWNFIEKEDVFIPNVFVDISGEVDIKVDAMQCYTSECRQYPHPRSPEAIKAYAHYWGLTVALEYAEPFRLIRDIKGHL
jgi:LmbE family N-acetylglucosaminyl deacetylase